MDKEPNFEKFKALIKSGPCFLDFHYWFHDGERAPFRGKPIRYRRERRENYWGSVSKGEVVLKDNRLVLPKAICHSDRSIDPDRCKEYLGQGAKNTLDGLYWGNGIIDLFYTRQATSDSTLWIISGEENLKKAEYTRKRLEKEREFVRGFDVFCELEVPLNRFELSAFNGVFPRLPDENELYEFRECFVSEGI